MQLCSLGRGDSSLGGSQPTAAPLIFASPSTKAKLLLLEKRLTGGASESEPPAGLMAVVGGSSRAADEANDMDEDVQLCAEIDPPQLQPANQHTPPGATGGNGLTVSASKRRKTGNPKHRPASGEQQQDSSRGAVSSAVTAAASGGRDRTPPGRGRVSPRADRAAGAAETAVGSSNPPMSPVAVGFTGSHALQRTPRSHSKQQAAHSKGQTNISKFFPLVMEGSSRDSDAPTHNPQQQQQVQLQRQQQKQQQPPLPLELTPIEDVFDAAHPAQQHDQQQQQQQQQQQVLPASALGRQRSGSCERQAPAAAAAAGTAATAAAGSGGGTTGPASGGRAPRSSSRVIKGGKGSSGGSSGGSGVGSVLQQQQVADLQAKHQQEVERLKQLARQEESRLQEALSASQQQLEQLNTHVVQLQHELAASRSAKEAHQSAVRSAVTGLVTQLAVSNSHLCRLQLSMDGTRLGCLGFSRTGPLGFTEVWEDGPVLRDLSVRLAALARSREEVEAARKALRKRLPPPPKATAAAAAAAADASSNVGGAGSNTADSSSNGSSSSQYLSQADFVMQDELFKVRLSVLKREEELMLREEERLTQEKYRHIRSLKRVRDEDSSRFSGQLTLNGRYVLLQLLGRGGFSEVHKAYDLDTLAFVAVKIHQLNSTWSEARKASYVRHAVREYTIHKALHHGNIVSLTDIFEVDNTTFATVLELCEGGDLEGHLQQFHTLPEREARAIISQVFAGLAHLNRGDAAGDAAGPRVIHYDLKPANILFDSLGIVKITDFGLSKVVEEGQTMGMELTSQGAGTYWYLPPECFQTAASSASMSAAAAAASRRNPAPGNGGGHGLLPAGILGGGVAGAHAAASAVSTSTAPLISNKVDVWSAGVILYQMLYGKRPFGEGLTQEQIYRDGVMLNARQVQFPNKPVVSQEGKAFLCRCLAYNQEERWDVLTAAADPYLQLKR